ncbi:MAG: response regulator transcription factor [Bradymonadaceae bacterium]
MDYDRVGAMSSARLTARTDTQDKVRGLQLGGDDYLTRPFWPEELAARIVARLRRPMIKREVDRTLGPLEIELDARQVRIHGVPVELTRVEFDLLAELARRPGMAVTRRQLVERALDDEREGTERTLDVHISRIRKKLGEASNLLETVWGIGYRLSSPEPEED